MQYKLGSCSFEEIAVAMICPVVGIYPERNEIVIHGGAVHFSKDYIQDKNIKTYGQVVAYKEKGWGSPVTECYLSSISQEHGIVKCSDKFINETKIGDLMAIIPVHSCLTMNLMKENYIVI